MISPNCSNSPAKKGWSTPHDKFPIHRVFEGGLAVSSVAVLRGLVFLGAGAAVVVSGEAFRLAVEGEKGEVERLVGAV